MTLRILNHSTRKTRALFDTSSGYNTDTNNWTHITPIRFVEDIALDNAIHVSYGDNDLVDYPESEMSGLCRYFLREYAGVVFENNAIYPTEREYPEKEIVKPKAKKPKKYPIISRTYQLKTEIIHHIFSFDDIPDMYKAVTHSWHTIDPLMIIPFVDVESPHGIIRFENRDGIIHVDMLKESA